MIYVAVWLCWFGVASLYAVYVMARRPRLRMLGAALLATSALLVFYLPIRLYLQGPDVEGFPDLSAVFEFLWVITFIGPLHLVYLLMLARRHLAKRGREVRMGVPTDS